MPENNIWTKILNWASRNHFIPMVVGSNCCGQHIFHLLNSVNDNEIQIANAESFIGKADLLIINGQINLRTLPKILQAYEKLGGKKYVMTIGSCTTTDLCGKSYNKIEKLENFIPVDIHVPGCPPLEEDFLRGLKELKNIR